MTRVVKCMVLLFLVGCGTGKRSLDWDQVNTTCSFFKINGEMYFGKNIDIDQNRKLEFCCDPTERAFSSKESTNGKQRKVLTRGFGIKDVLHYLQFGDYLEIEYVADKEGNTILNRIYDTSLTLSHNDSIYILYKGLDLKIAKSEIPYECRILRTSLNAKK